MAFRDELFELRRALKSANVKVADVLGAAKVDRSTWTRWNNGAHQPRFETWSLVRANADRLIAAQKSGQS
jgi:hypothetical protein